MIYSIEHLFYIKKEEDLKAFRLFMRKDCPSLRFVENPYQLSDNSWCIKVGSNNSDDMNKLGYFLENIESPFDKGNNV